MTGTPLWLMATASFLCFIALLVPLPWHIKNLNTGTCLFMIWTSVGCLIVFVNSIVWNGNAIDLAPVWCDISTRILIGLAVAIPSASLCINRRLYYIASNDMVVTTKAMRMRMVYVDLAIGMGIPVIQMCLQYVVQGHRYDIYEDVGCMYTTYTTWLSILLVSTWPIAIGCLSGVYCMMSLRAFNKRRKVFNEVLKNASMSLNQHSYFRLMALASCDLFCTVPLATWALVANIKNGINPWISWQNVHADFSRVRQYPAFIWKSQHYLLYALEMDRWLIVFCGVMFLAFFAFTEDARSHYKESATFVFKKARLPTSWLEKSQGTSSNIHSSTTRQYNPRKNSSNMYGTTKVDSDLDSLSDVDSLHCIEPKMQDEPSYDSFNLKDVGGLLSEKDGAYCGSSGSSSTLPSPSDVMVPPALPAPAHSRPRDIDEYLVEISSVYRASFVPRGDDSV